MGNTIFVNSSKYRITLSQQNIVYARLFFRYENTPKKMHIKHILILAVMIGVAHSRSYKAAMLGDGETDECDDCGLGFTCCLDDDGQGHVCCAHSLGFWCCKDKYGTGYCTMPWEDCP